MEAIDTELVHSTVAGSTDSRVSRQSAAEAKRSHCSTRAPAVQLLHATYKYLRYPTDPPNDPAANGSLAPKFKLSSPSTELQTAGAGRPNGLTQCRPDCVVAAN